MNAATRPFRRSRKAAKAADARARKASFKPSYGKPGGKPGGDKPFGKPRGERPGGSERPRGGPKGPRTK